MFKTSVKLEALICDPDGNVALDCCDVEKSILSDVLYEIRNMEAKLKEKEEKIKELERQFKVGTEDGSRCNRRCEGVMVLNHPESCSCFLGAPCYACEDNRPECSFCGAEVE